MDAGASSCGRVELVDSEAALERMRAAWDDLFENAVSPSVFLGWPWIRSWWQRFGEGRRLRILTVTRDGALLAAAPLEVTPCRLAFLPFKMMQIVGTAAIPGRGMGLSDRADFLIRRGHESCLGELLDFIARDPAWDVFRLRGLPEDSPTRAALVERLGGDTTVRQAERSESYALELPASWDDYLASRSAKWRKVHRARLNRAGREGTLEYERLFPCSRDDLERLWQTVVEVNGRSWKVGRGTGLLGQESLRGFMRTLAERAADAGQLDLSILRLDGRPFAYELYLTAGGVVGAYDGAYDESLTHLSPGVLLTAHILEDSIERGLKTLDFLRGDEPYKQRFGGTRRREFRVTVYRKRLSTRLPAWVAIEGRAFLKRQRLLVDLVDRLSGLLVRRRVVR